MRHILAALAVLAPFAASQTTTVFPSDFTNRAGNTSENRIPLSNGISRTQTVYDRRDLPIPVGRRITHIGIRQDDNSASTGKAIQLAIYMGGTTHEAGSLTSNFENNYTGTARTLVFGPSIVTLPDFSSQKSLEEFLIQLAQPYQVRADENLLVEWVVTANNNANQAFTYWIDEGTYYTETTTFGTGCVTSAGQVPQLSGSSSSYLGGNLSFSLSKAPASSLLWLNLNFVPDTPLSGDPFGAPGCTMYVLPVIALSGTGSTSGTASFGFPVPADPALFHAAVYGQCSIFDLFANNLGFAFSNGAKVVLGMYPLATTVVATGTASAATGSLRRNTAPVTLFRWN